MGDERFSTAAGALSPPILPVTATGQPDSAAVARLTVRHDDSEANVRNRLQQWELHSG